MSPSVLAAYLGPDPKVPTYLARVARSLTQVDIIDQQTLPPGHTADILIIDCRMLNLVEPRSPDAIAHGLVQLALVGEGELQRPTLFASGYFDYIFWPLIEQEVQNRLVACIAHIQRRLAPAFAIDPIAQRACNLLAHRLDQQISLSELARLAGTNRTTLVNRFETSFGCGPMAWLRHRRMVEAACQLRSSHQSIAEIARAVGYENSNNFSTSFKSIHGLSPLRYRKMVVRREMPV